jgi:hypothetical protein
MFVLDFEFANQQIQSFIIKDLNLSFSFKMNAVGADPSSPFFSPLNSGTQSP